MLGAEVTDHPHLPKYPRVAGLTFPVTHILLNSLDHPAMGSYWYQYGGGCLRWPSLYGQEDCACVSGPSMSRPQPPSVPAQPCWQQLCHRLLQPLRLPPEFHSCCESETPTTQVPGNARHGQFEALKRLLPGRGEFGFSVEVWCCNLSFPGCNGGRNNQPLGFTPANLPASSWPLGWNSATCSHASSFLHTGFGSWC